MAPGHRPSEAEIRKQAYYLWEQDGRPEGHDIEYWQRATVAVTEREQLSTLTDDPPKKPASKRKAAELRGATSALTGASGNDAKAKAAKRQPRK